MREGVSSVGERETQVALERALWLKDCRYCICFSVIISLVGLMLLLLLLLLLLG
jgi:hypothetical protein